MDRNIKVVEVTSELGAGTRGASLGVGALKTAAWNSKSSFFRDYISIAVKNFNEFLFSKNETPSAIRIKHVEKAFEEIYNSINSVFDNKDFPFVLAGDHSTAAATIASIYKSNSGKKLGVIWVDAHADLHSPYTSPSGNIHGMPLAIACGIDNLSQKVNEVSAEVKEYWERLKDLGGNNLSSDNLIFVGVRDTEAPEDFLIKEKEIKNFTVQEVKSLGGVEIANQALEKLSDCDMLYVSFDVDSMDPIEVSSGTGTPVENGIPVKEVTDLLTTLCSSPKLVCFETVEVNPTLDEKGNKMAEKTIEIIEKVATSVISSRN